MTKRRILIVGDEAGASGEVRRRLTALGYEVATTTLAEGQVAVKTAQAAPDLVLLDMVLSAVNPDVAALSNLRQHGDIPVVAIIAEADKASLQRATMAGASGSLMNPFTDRELRLTVELALCGRDTAEVVRETEDRFFTASIDMLCFLDFNGYFRRLNPAWEQTLGFTRKELMSRPFIEFVHPDDRDRTLAQNAQVRGGGQAHAFENRYLCKDGSYRWLHWNAAPDSTARVIYSVARDVTGRKQVEEERDQVVRELQSALAEVRTLRTILPICSYCRKIRDDENYWHTVEDYISRHTTSRFSHGICPSCMAAEVNPQLDDLDFE